MKNLFALLVAVFALNVISIAYAEEQLPEIAAVDEVAVQPLPDFVAAE
jgi:hypothetical protein